MLDLSTLDLAEIGNALADRAGYEHRWLISPQTGQIAFWTADTGIDGQAPRQSRRDTYRTCLSRRVRARSVPRACT